MSDGFVFGVFRADTASAIATGVSPVLALDANGAMFAHIVSTPAVSEPNVQPSGAFVNVRFTAIQNASTQFLAQDLDRTYFAIVNTGTVTVFMNFGANANVDIDFPLVAGGFYEPSTVPTDRVTGIRAAGPTDGSVFIMSISTP